jgi:hypothetical protein
VRAGKLLSVGSLKVRSTGRVGSGVCLDGNPEDTGSIPVARSTNTFLKMYIAVLLNEFTISFLTLENEMTARHFSTIERISVPLSNNVKPFTLEYKETLLIGSHPFDVPCPVDPGNPFTAFDAIRSGISVQRSVRRGTFLVGLRSFSSIGLEVSHHAAVRAKHQIPVWMRTQREPVLTTVLKLEFVGYDSP